VMRRGVGVCKTRGRGCEWLEFAHHGTGVRSGEEMS
jgi:hypothetical protein